MGKTKALASILAMDRATLLTRMAFFPESEKLDDLRELLTQDETLDVVTACKQLGLAPRLVLAAFTEASIAFDREVAKAAAHASLPDVVDRLAYHAMPQVRRCPRLCVKPKVGIKTVVMLGTEEAICPQCNGLGEYPQESEHMTWAADKLLKIGDLPEAKSGPLVQVNNNTLNAPALGAGFMEKMIALSDAVVEQHRYLPKGDSPEVVDALAVEAVAVLPEGN